MTAPAGASAAQRRNAAAVDQLERDATVSVRAAITAMLADVLAATGDTGVPVPETLAATARRAWARAVDRIMSWVRTTFGRLVTRAVDNLPDDLAPDLPPATVEERVAFLIDEVRAGLDTVPDLVASRVATQLRDGYAGGESPEQLRQRVADALGVDEWAPEAARIARTTTTSVYNAAHTAAADELSARLGEPLARMWLATRDSRTRPTHRKANGQVVQSGALFKVGDALMRFPGDPLGPPEEVILCRCVVVPVVADVVVDLAHRVIGREAAVLDEVDDMPMAAAAVPTSCEVLVAVRMIAFASAMAGATRIPPQLLTYWTVGEGALKIRWGQHGDFDRCRRNLRKYVRPDQLDGLCANLHHAALGVWPGREANAAAAAEVEEADMPCPCENDEMPVAADVVGDPDLPIADREMDWDGDAAADRVRAWATPDGAEMVDADRYARAFFYRDPAGSPETESAYKLGFADVDDGELVAVPAGIYAVASVLQGGRGGVDIPEADVDGVKDRVAGYYRRMAEQFDDDTLTVPWDDEPTAEDDSEGMAAADLEDAQTMAMVALVPSEADAARLAVDGDTAIPPELLHVTLAFLGDGEQWVDTPEGGDLLDLAEQIAADMGPITARVWATGVANPDSDDPAALYLIGDDTGRLAQLQGGVQMALSGVDMLPPQHSPFVAHVSTRYGDPSLDGMDQTGTDITLDRVRVAFAANVTDFPLTGDDTLDLDEPPADELPEEMMPEDEPVAAGMPLVADLRAANDTAAVLEQAAANAPERAPGDWFKPIAVTGPTPPTVTAEGRVWGHIGQADVCHAGITDECVTIPPTRTGYGAFHRSDMLTAEGDTVRVGYLYTGCRHSSLESTLDEAREYLGARCTATAAGRVYDTEWGPMFVGQVIPGVAAADVARLHKLSGEWFSAPLELHAAVGVAQAGFPVDGTGEEIRVSDEEPALAAAATVDGVPDTAAVLAAHQRRVAARAITAAATNARNRAGRVVAGYQRRG